MAETSLPTERQQELESESKERKDMLRTVGDALMSVVFLILVFGISLLCATCSGASFSLW